MGGQWAAHLAARGPHSLHVVQVGHDHDVLAEHARHGGEVRGSYSTSVSFPTENSMQGQLAAHSASGPDMIGWLAGEAPTTVCATHQSA